MSIEKLGRYFVAVEDPRCSGKVEHRLIDVLVIAVCAVIACAESWDDIALYGRSKLAWLRTFLELANGIPSHDTFRRVFMLIDPDAFEAGFAAWVGSLADRFKREVVAIDGKTVRRSFDHGREQSALHVVSGLVAKLAEVRRHVASQVAAIDRDIRHLVRTEPTLKRLTTVPGVGPITALAFLSAVDDPTRFKHARDVGPYLGLTPTRYQSGETDRHGRISKCGDTFTRTCLYEAAHVLLTKVQRFSPLKAWGMRLVKRIGGRKARIAVARKLAVILHCIWTDGPEFWWTREEANMA